MPLFTHAFACQTPLASRVAALTFPWFSRSSSSSKTSRALASAPGGTVTPTPYPSTARSSSWSVIHLDLRFAECGHQGGALGIGQRNQGKADAAFDFSHRVQRGL